MTDDERERVPLLGRTETECALTVRNCFGGGDRQNA